jgi:flagellar export protein FliJ
MAKFTFRLAKILELRRMEEDWACDAYKEAQARRIVAEHERDQMIERLNRPVAAGIKLSEMMALQAYRERLEDEIRGIGAAISILENEEESAKQTWIDKRRDAEALQKLYDADLAEWILEENRREQRESDEWSVLRRAA